MYRDDPADDWHASLLSVEDLKALDREVYDAYQDALIEYSDE